MTRKHTYETILLSYVTVVWRGLNHVIYKYYKGYKSSHDEHGVEDVVLEGEQGQTHVGEDEVFCQEVQQLEEL